MKKSAESSGSAQYDAPKVTVIEVRAEGILCSSGDVDYWKNNNWTW